MSSHYSVLTATLKNMRSTGLNREAIGLSIERKLDDITPEAISLYAQATNDENPAYRSEPALVPPFFVSRLIWNHVKELILNRNLNLNFFKMVHAEQEVSWFKPIYAGDRLFARMEIKDIKDTKAGEMLYISGSLFNQEGHKAAEATTGVMIKNNTNKGKNTPRSEEPPLREKARIELYTRKGQNLEYAKASTDTSFIHTSDFLARLTGLPRAIMHGICLMAMTCSAFTREFLDSDNLLLTSAKTRFHRPALPGERLILVCHEGKPGVTPFTVISEQGTTVLKNGIITHSRSDL
ncbi:MAG TPA: MaoC family dehydratase N-terminal domain-containing protein [Spirochaetota bacterium]|nr:MaoC family dehydratase N-terminal domain-containing protein [Spirochaetota bacterium]HPI89724.1 MaoC family dehydratase N-terminal domain-containing protein [Spirochaetota bacterium]HPR46643.1 MaoC family dehydratase N-terminal domain-containing protein [Spirochaetota bacterium]